MPQILLNASGFANLPAAAPAGWPSNITWPANLSPNTAVTLTFTDAGFQALLAWLAAGPRNAYLGGTAPPAPPAPAPTSQQLLAAWLNLLIAGTITAVQQFETSPAVPPAPIAITGT